MLNAKLVKLRLSPKALKLIKNYLSNRTQKVKTNGVISNSLPIYTGVPQGSCLGPLLFIIYIDDLSHVLKDCKVIFFADDTVVYHISSSFESSFAAMQRDFDLLHLWCRDNLLETNVDKTKSMYFCSKYLNSTSKPFRKLCLGAAQIEWVTDYKYLGINIDWYYF